MWTPAWRGAFGECGSSSNPSSRSGAYKQCLVLLLKIVQHFLNSSYKATEIDNEQKSLALSQGSTQLLVKTLDFSDLVVMTLNLSWNLIKEFGTNMPTDGKSNLTLSPSLKALSLASFYFSIGQIFLRGFRNLGLDDDRGFLSSRFLLW